MQPVSGSVAEHDLRQEVKLVSAEGIHESFTIGKGILTLSSGDGLLPVKSIPYKSTAIDATSKRRWSDRAGVGGPTVVDFDSEVHHFAYFRGSVGRAVVGKVRVQNDNILQWKEELNQWEIAFKRVI